MECIHGKRRFDLDRAALEELVRPYQEVHVDLGAGDGRYALHHARADPTRFVIGVDACRANLYRVSRRGPDNALFVIANALCLPGELTDLASHISIVFPWGSLVAGLLAYHSDVIEGLRAISRPGAGLDVFLNAGSLAEAGWDLDRGAARVEQVLREAGFVASRPRPLDVTAIRQVPSSWAKRLAYGRDPRAVALRARRVEEKGTHQFRSVG
ncbi:MAG: hypothetical protein ACR2JC_12060 [Chloroflexota bacterium]